MVATVDLWRALPGIERIESGVALTFDDGPDADGTPLVLDALDAIDCRATFFMVGEQVQANPAVAREVAERGHEIQLHCFRHVLHGSGPDPAEDIRRAREAIHAATGAAPAYQRPPYGRFSSGSHAACIDSGLRPVYWSAWGLDWETISADRIADLVNTDVAEGTIAVLHDSTRYAHRPSVAPTADALAAIASVVRELGLEFQTISAGSP
jgi:peptidoglycan/xylan/chitin deacetylase (PgdA/CDA1 family)